MNAKLTRADAYRLGYRCIICTNGTGRTPIVDGIPASKVGHNEGTYGWNWDLYQIAPGFVFVNGYRNFPHGDNKGTTGYREDHIIRDAAEFRHVETHNDHDCWSIFDSNGDGFTVDIARDGFSIVG